MVDMASVQFFNNGNSTLSGAITGQIYVWTGANCL